jgi:dTDP-4-dehydrorhamnose 3,5-epimerase
MIFTKTKIEGVYIIQPELRQDSRGYFTRVFCKEENRRNDLSINIAQINRSLTKKKGTIRGLHYQKNPKSEDKVVQCIQGAIFDVALDIRKKSPTFGQYIGVELNETNFKMLLIPKGCAHGFQTLKPNSLVQYFVSQYYYPNHEAGIRWDDPSFNIQWPIKNPTTSEKDKKWPDFR